jgi:asparagine synthase (glutamine-hydrolysing)
VCGFAGLMVGRCASVGNPVSLATRMSARLRHRGPDDSGSWVDPQQRVAFGFQRLAIIDLSTMGHQPMSSTSGRYTIVFNGEVYNFLQLREQLEHQGHRFRGDSDTEVILAALEQWGVRDAVTRFDGMFAIALWDESAQTLSLIRDRLGIKPLYFYARGGVLAFASELKALTIVPGFDATIDRNALVQYFRYLYIPAPMTIYRHVRKLDPGHILTIRDPGQSVRSEPYWDLADVMRRGLADPFRGSDAEATDALEEAVKKSVALHMNADVPVGAFLSAGVDSSTVVSMMQEISCRPVRTFSVAFDVARHNEADVAGQIASHLGTDHTELLLTGREALEMIPSLPEIFDEPYADTSQIPVYLLCREARKFVTVAVSGDGGDEVYGGYNRYIYGAGSLEKLSRLPRVVRRMASRGIEIVSPEAWARAYGLVERGLPRSARHRLPEEKIPKIGRLLGADSTISMYRSLVSAWEDPPSLVRGGVDSEGPLEAIMADETLGTLTDRMMLTDQRSYLPDDQLAKVDRVSMAVSLEVRVPLIDHRLVEFSWRLPPEAKTRKGVGKWLLREVLYRRVPRSLVDRPKMGLAVPLAEWLRGPLRPWAEALLSEDRLESEGVLYGRPIRTAWGRLQAGRTEAALSLWAVLMFQAWRECWVD